MQSLAARVVLAGLAVGIALPQARAQIQVAPGLNQNANNTGAMSGPYANQANRPGSGGGFVNPATLGGGNVGAMTSSQAAPSPYGGAGGIGEMPYPPFPFFGYGTYIPGNMGNLYGSATVINSLSKYMTDTQQTYLMQEKVKQEKLDTRRRVLEQWLWERNNLPTTQDEIERAYKLQLRRSQFDPPTNEIVAGRSLNDLLVDAQRLQGQITDRARAPDVGIPDNILPNINFAPKGRGNANAGILKDYKEGKPLPWPTELRGDDYEKLRDSINKLTRDAIQQASTQGQVDIGTLNELDRVVKQMSDDLRTNLNSKSLPSSSYIPARRFLDELGHSVKALGEADAKSYFDGKYTAQGKTTFELVKDMQMKGLEFGPATARQHTAYVTMHRLLADYDMMLNSNAGLQTSPR